MDTRNDFAYITRADVLAHKLHFTVDWIYGLTDAERARLASSMFFLWGGLAAPSYAEPTNDMSKWPRNRYRYIGPGDVRLPGQPENSLLAGFNPMPDGSIQCRAILPDGDSHYFIPSWKSAQDHFETTSV